VTSKNHQKDKPKALGGIWPKADRFHVFFPLGYTETSFDKVKNALSSMTNRFKYLDPAVSNPAQQFFGAVDSILIYNDGKNIKIDEFSDIPQQKENLFDECPEYLMIEGCGIEIINETYQSDSSLPPKREAIFNGLW